MFGEWISVHTSLPCPVATMCCPCQQCWHGVLPLFLGLKLSWGFSGAKGALISFCKLRVLNKLCNILVCLLKVELRGTSWEVGGAVLKDWEWLDTILCPPVCILLWRFITKSSSWFLLFPLFKSKEYCLQMTRLMKNAVSKGSVLFWSQVSQTSPFKEKDILSVWPWSIFCLK